MANSHLFLEHAANNNLLKIDVVSYVDYSVADTLLLKLNGMDQIIKITIELVV